MEIVIRRMTAGDYLAVDAMMRGLHGLHVENRPDIFKPSSHVYGQEEFERMMQDEGVAAYVAEVDKNPAGICIAVIKTSKETQLTVSRPALYLDDFYVLPEYRRRGIGRALIERIEKEGKRLGAERLDLMVWGFNESAQKFYESLGMTRQRMILEKKLGE